MANWCFNTVEFEGSKEALNRVAGLFEQMKKQQGEDNGYGQLPDFIKEKEGYMFDIDPDDTVEGSIFIRYQTKWCPNTDTIEKIAKHYGLDFILDYEELGNLIYGRTFFQDGVLTDVSLDEEDFENENSEVLERLLQRKIDKMNSEP